MTDDKVDSSDLATDSNSESMPVPEPSAATTPEAELSSKPVVTFRGNSYDLMSVVGVTIGGMVLLTCATCNMGFYCLPLAPIVLGAIGLAMAKDSVDPDRTRLLSWLSLGSGAAIVGLMILGVVLYISFIIFAIAANSGSF